MKGEFCISLYIIQILYFNLQDPTSSLESPTRLRCCVIFSRYIALWPKRLLRISFCNKGTHGHDNSGEINLQWYQVVSRDIPRRVSLSSFGIATFGFESRCYYLTDEGRVLYLQYIIQMLYFNLQDPNLSTMISSCKRCSTKSIVLLLRTRQLWKQLALLFAEMFHKEFRSPPLESNRVAICYYLLRWRESFVFHYYTNTIL